MRHILAAFCLGVATGGLGPLLFFARQYRISPVDIVRDAWRWGR